MTFRRATAADDAALRDLERDANLVALGHVFPPAEFAFPGDEVRERWSRVLADPGVTVEVVGGGPLVCFVAYDDDTVRHLAVHPDRWGSGLARAALARAVEAIRAGGRVPRLWCLAANDRAYGMYRHLGWTLTGVERRSEWTPYPVERELVLLEGSPDG